MEKIENLKQETAQERVIVVVIGQDKVGIIARVATALSGLNANILDISQTILNDFFTMIMVVDIGKSDASLEELQQILQKEGESIGVTITVQHENIFKYMHRI